MELDTLALTSSKPALSPYGPEPSLKLFVTAHPFNARSPVCFRGMTCRTHCQYSPRSSASLSRGWQYSKLHAKPAIPRGYAVTRKLYMGLARELRLAAILRGVRTRAIQRPQVTEATRKLFKGYLRKSDESEQPREESLALQRRDPATRYLI